MEIISVLITICVSLVLLSPFIFLNYKGKIKVAVLLLLILTACKTVCVGLIYIFALPRVPAEMLIEPSLAFLPLFTGLGIIILSIFLFLKKDNVSELRSYSGSVGWVSVVAGILLVGCSFSGFCIYLYAPSALGLSLPSAKHGVLIFLLGVFFANIFYCLGTRGDGKNKPNIIRWVIFWFVLLHLDIPITCSLILIYANPVDYVDPFWASIVTLGLIPCCITLFLVATRSRNQAS